MNHNVQGIHVQKSQCLYSPSIVSFIIHPIKHIKDINHQTIHSDETDNGNCSTKIKNCNVCFLCFHKV